MDEAVDGAAMDEAVDGAVMDDAVDGEVATDTVDDGTIVWVDEWCYYIAYSDMASSIECLEPQEPESSEDSGFRLPEIEFTTGDEAEIEEWEQEREETYREIEESWEAAVRDVVNAIQQPVNDFIDTAGLLDM